MEELKNIEEITNKFIEDAEDFIRRYKEQEDKIHKVDPIKDLELGNKMFNTNVNQDYICPDWIVALLNAIDDRLELTLLNHDHKEYNSPFSNTAEKFKNDVFEVEAYSWDDDYEQPYNFKCGDIEISWYKYLGRDTTINGNYSAEYIVEMFNKCIQSLKDMK